MGSQSRIVGTYFVTRIHFHGICSVRCPCTNILPPCPSWYLVHSCHHVLTHDACSMATCHCGTTANPLGKVDVPYITRDGSHGGCMACPGCPIISITDCPCIDKRPRHCGEKSDVYCILCAILMETTIAHFQTSQYDTRRSTICSVGDHGCVVTSSNCHGIGIDYRSINGGTTNVERLYNHGIGVGGMNIYLLWRYHAGKAIPYGYFFKRISSNL